MHYILTNNIKVVAQLNPFSCDYFDIMIFLFRSIPLSVLLSVPLSVTPQSELIGPFRQGRKNMDFPLSVLNSMFHFKC